MLVLLFSADIGLVHFHRATEHLPVVMARRSADTPEHVPRGFLGDADVLGQLNAGDALNVAGVEPDRRKPLGQQLDRAIRENGPRDDAEYAPALSALVPPTVAVVVDLFAPAAVRAICAIGPSGFFKMLQAGFNGGELLCTLQQVVHDGPLSIRPI